MSDHLGRHFCQKAEDLDDFGYAYCPFLEKRIRCYGLDEECEIERQVILK